MRVPSLRAKQQKIIMNYELLQFAEETLRLHGFFGYCLNTISGIGRIGCACRDAARHVSSITNAFCASHVESQRSKWLNYDLCDYMRTMIYLRRQKSRRHRR